MFRNVIVLVAGWSIMHVATADLLRTGNSEANYTKVDNASTGAAKFKSQFSENVTSTESSFIITLLNNAKTLIEDAKKYTSLRTSSGLKTVSKKPMDCFEVQEQDQNAKSGIYKIWPISRLIHSSINVYCDMDDDGGGWTVIQRRGNFDSGKDYFHKDWKAYATGFGDLVKDFWLGNDNIYALTNQRTNKVKFILSDWEGNTTYATYDEFRIEDETRKYTMHVSGYRGTAGDSFSNTNGVQFSTKDQENDTHDTIHCAVMFKGGWWFNNCHRSNLNGPYEHAYFKRNTHLEPRGVEWQAFRGLYYSLKDTIIKIRPKDFNKGVLDITQH